MSDRDKRVRVNVHYGKVDGPLLATVDVAAPPDVTASVIDVTDESPLGWRILAAAMADEVR